MDPIFFTVVIIVMVVMVLCFVAAAGGNARVVGGASNSSRASPHIVIDTLNLVHWLAGADAGAGAGASASAAGAGTQASAGASAGASPVTTASIVAAIDRTAPALRARYLGRVMYVLKDRESSHIDADTAKVYQAVAERQRVYVVTAERYRAGMAPAAAGTVPASHSTQGRDDYFAALLADRYRCTILTNDHLQDFESFHKHVPPFYTTEYAFWRALPVREFVRPSTFNVRRPRTARFSSFEFTPQKKKKDTHSNEN